MTRVGKTTFVDLFDRPQALTTTPGVNGWTVKDTSSAGTPTYLCGGSGNGMQLTCDNTSEAQNVCMYFNDVLPYNILKIDQVWFDIAVAGIDAVSTVLFGVGSARNDAGDSVTTSAWFRMEGSASTSNLLWETDDNTTNDDDNATGTTLAATVKHCVIDFSQGMSNIRFLVDGALVSSGAAMAAITSATYVQPIIQVQKASGTGVPAVNLREFGIRYAWSH